jgi:hypothetical protein
MKVKTMVKGIVQLLYDEILYPAAKAFVSKTSNPYDDQALAFLDQFIKELMDGI